MTVGVAPVPLGRTPDAMRRARHARRRAAASRRRGFGWMAVGVDAAILTLFGAAYSARYVPPPLAWPLQVAALALPVAAVAVAAAGTASLFYAARVRTRPAWAAVVLHAGVAGLALARYGPALVPDEGPAGAAPDALRVLTLNAGMDIPTAGPLAADIASMIEPDVVAMQETVARRVDEDGRIGAGQAALGFLSGADYAILGEDKDDRLAVFVREGTPTGDTRWGTLDPTNPEMAGVMKRVELALQGRPFALYTVHFRSYGRSGGPLPAQAREVREDLEARAREARLFRSLLDAEDLPYIVVGDFNATPDQWTYAHVAAGLQDALSGRAGWAPTYPDGRPVVQIDAVLASSEWEVVSAEVLPSGLSDHRGVLAGLRWRERGAR